MSFDGTWVVEIATPIGKQTVTLDILDREGQLAGTATRDGECVPFEDVTRDGNRLRWTQRVTRPMRLTLQFDLVRTGSLLAGTAKAGVLPASKIQGIKQG